MLMIAVSGAIVLVFARSSNRNLVLRNGRELLMSTVAFLFGKLVVQVVLTGDILKDMDNLVLIYAKRVERRIIEVGQ